MYNAPSARQSPQAGPQNDASRHLCEARRCLLRPRNVRLLRLLSCQVHGLLPRIRPPPRLLRGLGHCLRRARPLAPACQPRVNVNTHETWILSGFFCIPLPMVCCLGRFLGRARPLSPARQPCVRAQAAPGWLLPAESDVLLVIACGPCGRPRGPATASGPACSLADELHFRHLLCLQSSSKVSHLFAAKGELEVSISLALSFVKPLLTDARLEQQALSEKLLGCFQSVLRGQVSSLLSAHLWPPSPVLWHTVAHSVTT